MGRTTAERDVLAALPRLGRQELIPEINALTIGPDGRLVLRSRRTQLTLTFEHAGRRITARFSRKREAGPVTLELGCRLLRLPYTAEARARRRQLLACVAAHTMAGPGELAVTPDQWLYLRDRILLEPAPLTVSWLVTRLVLALLLLAPALARFAEIDQPEEAPSPRTPGHGGGTRTVFTAS